MEKNEVLKELKELKEKLYLKLAVKEIERVRNIVDLIVNKEEIITTIKRLEDLEHLLKD